MLAAVGAERRNRKHREGGLEGLEPHGVFDGTPRRVSSPSGDPGGKANRRPDGKSRDELRLARGDAEHGRPAPQALPADLDDCEQHNLTPVDGGPGREGGRLPRSGNYHGEARRFYLPPFRELLLPDQYAPDRKS